ncbi:MAG: hypothetical protein KA319_09290 [Ferruginibacter sp.]|nr:hypothetical protein [Ferruginibacter sp.]
MRKVTILLFATIVIFNKVNAQSVAVNNDGSTANASSILDVKSTIKGMLIPRMTKAEKAAITAPASGLLIYQNAPDSIGFHYYNGTNWIWILDANGVNGTAWKLLGNSSTNPATHFIGTTDLQSLVFKTGGSAATNERMRIAGAGTNPGQVSINNTTAFTDDVFSVYANNTGNGVTNAISNTMGVYAINGYAPAGGGGVYGNIAGASGFGSAVFGNTSIITTSTNSSTQGLFGLNSSTPANNTATVIGVLGRASATSIGTGFSFGLYGLNDATAGNGGAIYGSAGGTGYPTIIGFQTNTTQIAIHAVQGQASGNGGAAGLRGYNTAAAIGNGQFGYGVRGSVNATPSGTGFSVGVRGSTVGTTGSSYGVYGDGTSANGFAFGGLNNNTSGTGMLIAGNNSTASYITAGSGIAVNGSTIGTFSIAKTAASGTGVVAVGNNLTGSILTLGVGSGIAATGTQYGVAGFATTTVNTDGTNTAGTNGASASAGGYFEVQNAGGVPQTWAYVGVRDNTGTNRKIIGNGTVNTIVKDYNNKMVMLSAPESPENLFQDYGQGKLINGKAHITIDPTFAKNILVNDNHPLRIFVQLEGDSKGVYVTNKTQFGFDVVELSNGQSNINFTYTVIGNRANEINNDGTKANYAEERFAPAPGAAKTQQLKVTNADLDIIQKQQDFPADQAPEINVPVKNIPTKQEEDTKSKPERKSLKNKKDKICKVVND